MAPLPTELPRENRMLLLAAGVVALLTVLGGCLVAHAVVTSGLPPGAEPPRRVSLVTVLQLLACALGLTTAIGLTWLAFRRLERDRSRFAREASEASAQEALHEALLSSAADPIFLVDRTFRIGAPGLATLRVLGQQRSTVEGCTLAEVLPAFEASRLQEAVARTFKRTTPERLELVLSQNVDVGLHELLLTPLMREGYVEAVLVIGRDISDHKQAQASLASSHRRVTAILEAVTDGFVSMDRRWRYHYVNRAAEALLQAPRAELEGRTMWENFPDLVGTPTEQRLRQAAAACEPLHLEVYFQPGRRWLELNIYPTVEGSTVYFRDVTQRHRIAEAERFLVDASAALAQSLDLEETLQRACALTLPDLGDLVMIVPADATRTEPVIGCHPPGELEAHKLLLTGVRLDEDSEVGRALREGTSRRFEDEASTLLRTVARDLKHLRALEELGLGSSMAIPLGLAAPFKTAMLVFRRRNREVFDETDLNLGRQLATRISLALESARLYRKARMAIQAREEILAVVSHDLKNPVNAVLLVGRLLAQGSASPERAASMGRTIERAADRMQRLIADLLDAASLDAGTLSVRLTRLPLGELLEEARNVFAPLAEEKEIRLVFEEAPPGAELLCDRARVQQVLSNLVGNALKYSPARTIVRVAVEKPNEQELCFSVSDQGQGLTREQTERVFDRFWRGKDRPEEGAGLGLSIAKGLVEAQGGSLWVESREGHGSTFSFTLPLCAPHSNVVDPTRSVALDGGLPGESLHR